MSSGRIHIEETRQYQDKPFEIYKIKRETKIHTEKRI